MKFSFEKKNERNFLDEFVTEDSFEECSTRLGQPLHELTVIREDERYLSLFIFFPLFFYSPIDVFLVVPFSPTRLVRVFRVKFVRSCT